ncbi:unnamed protein product [Pipistrellus nathusii]|uniref:Uncharacterized protein n=1 Tax=Pipistrellus nathusii TaxID=59473 RepID=A0ABN9ZLL8_PIPNA
MHVKITYQSNQMGLEPSQSKEQWCPQKKGKFHMKSGLQIHERAEPALASLAQWTECKGPRFDSCQWHMPGGGLNAQLGACRRQPISDSLSSLMFLTLLPSSLKLIFFLNFFKGSAKLTLVSQN